ncbi:putative CDP-diacylglycerol--glycerol-3-phosphate 3-phosphatidyltransferase [Melia azedarach]|uniref:CDP-diacylglycerol--glycerol-3-phosphate 3-phosphatidyltransferase n=1 Tax=Melia azedarach TaxID=155640 RepID=A0ACC1XIK8_MELAZ|nr:putative CDP-diacylglycerol--glycerol-3-phosphate 3-phosphatidyltransferase [Melia azedarach]
MGSKDSYSYSNGNAWADQWDNNNSTTNNVNPTANYYHDDKKARYKKKVGEGLDKTKEVAISGMKKAKLGASASFKWIKQKCNKN